MRRAAAVTALLLIALSGPAGAQRRRAVAYPAVSDALPAGWLANHAFRDLDAVRVVIGTSPVVGLGDDTHGTHEFFETKLQMIQELVRDGDFRTVALEAPFADFAHLNDYVLGGAADPRALLLHRELGYWFWADLEILDVIEWMRSYNMSRGEKPAVEIAGFDVYDPEGASALVIDYLNGVDPVAAASAIASYSSCIADNPPSDCSARLAAITSDLASREIDLAGRSSPRAFDTALHASKVASESLERSRSASYVDFAWRDQKMAINALDLQQRHSSNGRIILWAHQEHLGRTIDVENVKPMGKWLDEQLGRDYFVIGTCSGEGMFNVLNVPRDPDGIATVGATALPTIESNDYEAALRSAALPLMLIPLRGTLPQWLSSPHSLRGGTSGSAYDKMETLPLKFDAILYIDRTTPSENFW